MSVKCLEYAWKILNAQHKHISREFWPSNSTFRSLSYKNSRANVHQYMNKMVHWGIICMAKMLGTPYVSSNDKFIKVCLFNGRQCEYQKWCYRLTIINFKRQSQCRDVWKKQVTDQCYNIIPFLFLKRRGTYVRKFQIILHLPYFI